MLERKIYYYQQEYSNPKMNQYSLITIRNGGEVYATKEEIKRALSSRNDSRFRILNLQISSDGRLVKKSVEEDEYVLRCRKMAKNMSDKVRTAVANHFPIKCQTRELPFNDCINRGYICELRTQILIKKGNTVVPIGFDISLSGDGKFEGGDYYVYAWSEPINDNHVIESVNAETAYNYTINWIKSVLHKA